MKFTVQAVVKGKGKYPTQLFANTTIASENGSTNATNHSFSSTVSTPNKPSTHTSTASKKSDLHTQTSINETRGRVSTLSKTNTNGIDAINNGLKDELMIDTNEGLEAKNSLLSPKHLTSNKTSISSPRQSSSGQYYR